MPCRQRPLGRNQLPIPPLNRQGLRHPWWRSNNLPPLRWGLTLPGVGWGLVHLPGVGWGNARRYYRWVARTLRLLLVGGVHRWGLVAGLLHWLLLVGRVRLYAVGVRPLLVLCVVAGWLLRDWRLRGNHIHIRRWLVHRPLRWCALLDRTLRWTRPILR